MCGDILERDTVLAQDIGIAVRPDMCLCRLKLRDDCLKFCVFFDARGGFVESVHDIPELDGVEWSSEDVCGGKFPVDAVDDMDIFEPREYGLDGGDGVDALDRERFCGERRIAGAEVPHECSEDFDGGIFADEHPFALRARGLVETSLELERVHVLHDIARLDAEEQHHPCQVEPQECDGQDAERSVKDAVIGGRFERDVDVEAEAEFGDFDENGRDRGGDDRVAQVHAGVRQELEDDEARDREHDHFGDDRRELVVGELAGDELRGLENRV